jgi:hypothetical protein
MRRGDPKVTLEHYAHIVSNADKEESEKLSRRIGQNLAQLESESVKNGMKRLELAEESSDPQQR